MALRWPTTNWRHRTVRWHIGPVQYLSDKEGGQSLSQTGGYRTPYGVLAGSNLFGFLLVTCSQMLWIKNKATKLLKIKDLRPPKYYLLLNIMIFRRRSWRTCLHHSWESEYIEIINVIHPHIYFIMYRWILIEFTLHWYLRLVRRCWRESGYNSAWTVRWYCSSIYRHGTQPG
jgi:hypothetical protein